MLISSSSNNKEDAAGGEANHSYVKADAPTKSQPRRTVSNKSVHTRGYKDKDDEQSRIVQQLQQQQDESSPVASQKFTKSNVVKPKDNANQEDSDAGGRNELHITGKKSVRTYPFSQMNDLTSQGKEQEETQPGATNPLIDLEPAAQSDEEGKEQNDTSGEIYGQKEDTLRDMFDNKNRSLKSSGDETSDLSATSQFSVQSFNNRGPFLPEPLPLFDGPAEEEPHLLNGFRRHTKIFKSGIDNDMNRYCPHEDVADWTCRECKKRIPQFEIFCDDYQGRCTKFLKVCYENQFLQDFLSEQVIELENVAAKERIEMLNKGVNADDVVNAGLGKRNPDIIYQCYQPINVTEMREFMFFCMSQDILASENNRNEELGMKGESPEKEEHIGVGELMSDQNDENPGQHIYGNEEEGDGSPIGREKMNRKQALEAKIHRLKTSWFAPALLHKKLGNGSVKNLSVRLARYLQELEESMARLIKKYDGDVLMIDTVFESGNLLRADRITPSEYRLYMQVDTNTRGHQQWFYFRVRNTRRNRKYTFKIMNFTKPGITGGAGYRKNELFQRIVFKSKVSKHSEWMSIGPERLEFEKTTVQRRKKDALAAAADSDQEDWVEEAYGSYNPNAQNIQRGDQPMDDGGLQRLASGGDNKGSPLKKKRKFCYYALVFDYEFENDDDIVYFAFAQPYSYSQVMSEIFDKEDEIKPSLTSQITGVPRKVIGQNPQPPPVVEKAPGLDRQTTIKEEKHETVKAPLQRTSTFVQKKKDLNDDQTKAQASAAVVKDELESGEPKNGPRPIEGIQFENKNLLLYYRRQEMCRSICGLPLWYITISRDSKNLKRKPNVIISTRVHSGETPASTVFKGILDFLCSDRKEAKFLRKFYTFVLIPVLNPDGVVCGNYRNSIAGVDLNRQWINPDIEFHPEVFYIKNLFKTFTENEKRHIWIYCDIHGHSKKKNSFFYGCNTAANGGFLSWTIVRILPRIFAQKTHLFNYRDCRFKVEPYKIGTGRVVAWKQFQITHSFTLENSFYGFDFGEDESKEFSQDDYQTVGSKFVESIYELHFVWKQIKRELQVTNGWLKPKVLFEKTGVPAAQILNEELEKKKKEEKKLAAIQQYQSFLRKFYNQGRGPIINPIPTSQSKIAQDQLRAKAQGLGSGKEQYNSQITVQNFAFSNSNSTAKKQPNADLMGIGAVGGSGYKSSKFEENSSSGHPSPDGKSRNPNGKSSQASDNKCTICGSIHPNTRCNSKRDRHMEEQQVRLMQKNGASQDNGGDEADDMSAQLYRSLLGLVKLQALVRGIRARKRVAKMLAIQRKRNERELSKVKSSNLANSIQKHTASNSVLRPISHKSKSSEKKVIRPASFREKRKNVETSSEDNMDEILDGVRIANPMAESKDTLSGSGFEHLSRSSRRVELMNRDWRHFFEETELDTAFQRVEIEQREISEEGSSAGSSSNPSEDNLDQNELADNVYNMSEQNKKLQFQQRKEQEAKLIKQVTESPVIVSGQQLFNKIAGKASQDTNVGKDQNAGRNILSGMPSRRGTLKFYRGFNQKTNSSLVAMNHVVEGESLGPKNDQANGINGGASPYFQIGTNDGSNLANGSTKNGQGIMSQQTLNQRSSNTHSPMNALEQYAINDYNMSSTNIAFQQIHGKGILLSKDQIKPGRHQQRATTSHINGLNGSFIGQSLASHGYVGYGHPQSVHQPNISQQMRNLNISSKGPFAKKENINQVIKDCFITKKFGVRKPQAGSSQGVSAGHGAATHHSGGGGGKSALQKPIL